MNPVHSLKEDALKAISSLPETANIDDIMYRLYVIDKVRKGQEAVEKGETIIFAKFLSTHIELFMKLLKRKFSYLP